MIERLCGATTAIQYVRRHYVFGVLAAVLLSLVLASDVAIADVYYVDVDGLGGPSSDRNPGTIDRPFKTIERARDYVRASGTGGHTVYVRGGSYRLARPLVFDKRDSGKAGRPNVYRGYRGEQPVISGGQVLSTPWTIYSGNIWRCDVGSPRFRSLWVDGQRAQRAKEPDEDPTTEYLDYHITAAGSGSDGFVYSGTDISPTWTNLGQVEVVYFHEWKCPRMVIGAINTVNKDVIFTSNANVTCYSRNRYWVENVFEGLDEPGEWYLNASAGVLYYYPVGGKNPNTSEVVYPVIGGTAMGFTGRLLHAYQCDYVEFHGLSFEHTDWWLSREGYRGWQAASALEWHDDDIWRGTGPALCFMDCEHCVVQDGEVRHVGGNGIVIGGKAIKINRNRFSDVGASAIRVGGINGESGPYATDQGHHVIADNSISDFGVVWPEGVGVFILASGHNTVMHNVIHDGAYTGISVGFRWDFLEDKQKQNTIAFNDVYDVMRRFDDGAGIYLLGNQPGTVVCQNKVHDIPSIASAIYPSGVGGIGLYLDQGCKDVILEKNWVYRVNWGFQLNPLANCVVQNNVFVDCASYYWVTGNATCAGESTADLLRNVYYSTSRVKLYNYWQDRVGAADYNTFYSAAGWDSRAGLDEWKGEDSFEVNSIEEDPSFADPGADDFTVGNNSVSVLGFEPITGMDTVGPR